MHIVSCSALASPSCEYMLSFHGRKSTIDSAAIAAIACTNARRNCVAPEGSNMEKALNLVLCQRLRSSLPASVKPMLPPAFHGKMGGTTVSKFVHQLDAYFDLVDLKADNKRGLIAVGLLEGQSHTWHQM